MANYQLTVEPRTETGKSYARKLRATQKIPAIIYGSGNPAINIEVGSRDAERALSASGSLINLDLAGDSKTVIVKDVHRDPVRGTLLHLDFHEIDLTKKLEITVPVRALGEDARVNDGGVLTLLLWEVTVSCLPTDIPEAIEVDVSELELDQTITVAELNVPAGVEILDDADEAVVKVDIPEMVLEEDEEELDEDGEAVEGEETEEEEEAEADEEAGE
ncbi:MAG: 50S ribosomal protein L25 [Bacillota bacterium]|nr:50S ribosomal protein L25 [Bacillota bacterium]